MASVKVPPMSIPMRNENDSMCPLLRSLTIFVILAWYRATVFHYTFIYRESRLPGKDWRFCPSNGNTARGFGNMDGNCWFERQRRVQVLRRCHAENCVDVLAQPIGELDLIFNRGRIARRPSSRARNRVRSSPSANQHFHRFRTGEVQTFVILGYQYVRNPKKRIDNFNNTPIM